MGGSCTKEPHSKGQSVMWNCMCDAGLPKANLAELHFYSSRCTEHRHLHVLKSSGAAYKHWMACRWCIQDILKLESERKTCCFRLKCNVERWHCICGVPSMSASDDGSKHSGQSLQLQVVMNVTILKDNVGDCMGSKSYISVSRDQSLCPVCR